MAEILKKFYELGWQHRIVEYQKITFKKYGKKRIGTIKIDIENEYILCYNINMYDTGEQIESRELTFEELVLIYKLIKEIKR